MSVVSVAEPESAIASCPSAPGTAEAHLEDALAEPPEASGQPRAETGLHRRGAARERLAAPRRLPRRADPVRTGRPEGKGRG